MRLHSGENHFNCHQCGQGFPDKRRLTWHEKVICERRRSRATSVERLSDLTESLRFI
ncbi:Zinc finger protein 626 [Labeo rohita]|uniref:Zinc finger protein 626 n=1 Tax=Labeo rohita TaxID=84645 RepID=A0ABQ8L083_LABRO|nr:Zinc finger protein 626 [Labeo rohita]